MQQVRLPVAPLLLPPLVRRVLPRCLSTSGRSSAPSQPRRRPSRHASSGRSQSDPPPSPAKGQGSRKGRPLVPWCQVPLQTMHCSSTTYLQDVEGHGHPVQFCEAVQHDGGVWVVDVPGQLFLVVLNRVQGGRRCLSHSEALIGITLTHTKSYLQEMAQFS